MQGALIVAAASALAAATFVGKVAADDDQFGRFGFVPGTLVLSRSVYVGTASTVTVGQTLPPGCVAGNVAVPLIAGGNASVAVTCATAIADGTYPTVFNNNGPTAVSASPRRSSSTTSPRMATARHSADSQRSDCDQLQFEIRAGAESVAGRKIDHVHGLPRRSGIHYGARISWTCRTPTLRASSTRPIRCVAVLPLRRGSGCPRQSAITEGNAYSGNNGRAAIKGDWLYYMTGNDNNGGLSNQASSPKTQVGVNLVSSTGAELLVPGQAPPVAAEHHQDRGL